MREFIIPAKTAYWTVAFLVSVLYKQHVGITGWTWESSLLTLLWFWSAESFYNWLREGWNDGQRNTRSMGR